ncbi:hypothetical protein [Thiocystis violacea]|uniref:hypothetical protein n=1 Tax=Thiocystis violacea TaxID=13725 RepID=UPI001A92BA11|nr:hypothetical protein [Thiocystis violacea]
MHSAQDVAGYLERVGRLDRISDWQFEQIVNAIQNLLETARAPVVDEIDWEYWRDSARTLTPDHPTIARESPPAQIRSGREKPVSGAHFKEKEEKGTLRPGKVACSSGYDSRLGNRAPRAQYRALRRRW